MVVLADDERAERLPRFLTQHPDARRILDSPGKSGIGGKPAFESSVIPSKIEIGVPDLLEGGAADPPKPHRIPFPGDAAAFFVRNADKTAVHLFFPTKSLSAVEGLRKIKIRHIRQENTRFVESYGDLQRRFQQDFPSLCKSGMPSVYQIAAQKKIKISQKILWNSTKIYGHIRLVDYRW